MEDHAVKIINLIRLPVADVKLREDGIIHLDIRDEIQVTVEAIHQMNAAVARMGREKKYPNLVTAGRYTSVTKEARDFAATAEANIYTIADAYVLHAFHQKILGNFFVKINKPMNPVRFFDNESEAVAWLRGFLLR